MKPNTPPDRAAPDEGLQPSARTDGRARAWLILLAMLAVVFFVAWLLGFFNV